MKRIASVIFLISIWSFGAMAYAQTMPGGGINGGSICDKILNESKDKINPEKRKEQMQQNAQQKRQQQDQQIIQKRTQNNEKRQSSHERILALADTEEKKAAVEVFKQEAESAISEFQNMQDQITAEFRSGVDEIVSNIELSKDSKSTKLESVGNKVLMNDMKTYCEEGTFTEEEISKMMETNGLKIPGTASFSTNDDMAEIKDENKEKLILAREQMQKSLKNAAEKLKASF